MVETELDKAEKKRENEGRGTFERNDFMKRKVLGRCPVCYEALSVTRLHCDNCHTTIEGGFDVCKFCQLSPELKEFVEVFIRSRGNIKEVERELGVSYPTVRNRLDTVIEALGYTVDRPDSEDQKAARRRAVLEQLGKGELSMEEAMEKIKQI